jgi:glycosyltransferase involved in cell wall biosynthesis
MEANYGKPGQLEGRFWILHEIAGYFRFPKKVAANHTRLAVRRLALQRDLAAHTEQVIARDPSNAGCPAIALSNLGCLSRLSGGPGMLAPRRPIIVLHRYPVSEVGDTNPSMWSFLENLANLGYHTVYVSLNDKTPIKRSMKGVEFLELGMVLDRQSARSKFAKSFLFIMLMPWLSRLLVRKYHPALIYCDDSLPFYSFVLKKFSGTKVIARLGDLQTGYHLLGGSRLFSALFRMVHFVEKQCWRTLDGLIPISEAFGAYVNSLGIDPHKISIVPESVDLKRFKPVAKSVELMSRWLLAPTDAVIMFHGAIEPLKGLDRLLELYSKCLTPTSRTKLVIIGDGSARVKLSHQAHRLGISDRVIFPGWIPNHEIPLAIALCEIGIPMRSCNPANDFVLTSAMLQYWACGKPVLAPRFREMTRVIEESGGGYSFEFGNEEDFKNALKDLLDSEDLRKTRGEAGRNFVSENYGCESVGRNLARVVSDFAS